MTKILTQAEVDALKNALQTGYDSMQKTHDFKPGQFVQWKKGMQNKKFPRYGEPAIIWEVLSAPLFDKRQESASAYFQEPLDIILGIVTEEDELVSFYYDKRRFEPFQSTIKG